VQANAAASEGQLTDEELSQVNEILDDNLE
jgi:hypothetical protein